MKMRAETAVLLPCDGNPWDHLRPEEGGKTLLQRLQKEPGPGP